MKQNASLKKMSEHNSYVLDNEHADLILQDVLTN